jgi:hypothetical protein
VRHRSPRGSAAVLLTVAISLLLVGPAAAAGGISLTPAPRTLTGSALAVVPTGGGAQGGVTLVVTDAAGGEAVFRFGAAAVVDGRPLSVDLSSPDSGAAPRNGRATVTLSDSTGMLAQTQVTIDRTPSAPSLTATPDGRRVRVSWSDAATADTVKYRLERSAGGSAQVVYEGASTAFTDRALSPGPVTYALAAGVPGGGGTNWSPPATASVKVVGPATPDAAQPDAEPPAGRAGQAAQASRVQPAARGERPQPRRVTVSGAVRAMGGTTAAVGTPGYASAPSFDASAVPHVAAAAPLVAAPRGSSPAHRLPNPFPTRMLGVPSPPPAAAGAPSPIMALACAVVLLTLATAQVLRSWREHQELQRLVVALTRKD